VKQVRLSLDGSVTRSPQFGADQSVMKGTWVNGSITNGQWIYTDGTVYTGTFSGGKPVGPGSFALPNGITQVR
jgi:hypothetical protein